MQHRTLQRLSALRYLERMDDAGETNARVAGTTPRTGRLRVLAVLAALGLLYFPGLGAVDLASAIVGLSSRDELVGMRAACGLVVGFLLPATLFLLAARPTGTAAPVQQVLVVAVAFLLTAVASGLWTALVGGAGLLVLGAALGRLAPGDLGVPRAASDAHLPLLALAGLGAIPWLVYAGVMALRQRNGTGPYEDFTLGVQGWSALTLFALVMVLNSAVSTFRPPGWRATLLATGIASLLFGLVGLWADEVPGSLGRAWGAAAVLWGVVLACSPWIAWRMPARNRRSQTQ